GRGCIRWRWPAAARRPAWCTAARTRSPPTRRLTPTTRATWRRRSTTCSACRPRRRSTTRPGGHTRWGPGRRSTACWRDLPRPCQCRPEGSPVASPHLEEEERLLAPDERPDPTEAILINAGEGALLGIAAGIFASTLFFQTEIWVGEAAAVGAVLGL